jgi:lipid II:glycine glycyltransferase (peptidoglycan interpeptide bridge formation enzyme)
MSVDIIVDSCDQKEWGKYADNFADYSIYQTMAYQQVRAETDRQQIKRIVIKEQNGKEILMCNVRIKTMKPIGLTIGYVQFGPLMLWKNGQSDCLSEALRCLRESCFKMNINVLRITPNVVNNETGKKISELLEAAGFRKNRRLPPYHSCFVSLKEHEEEIYSRIHRDNRRIIRKAEKMQIEVREGTGDEFFETLEQLYILAKKRKGFEGVDAAVFAKVQKMLADSEKAISLIAYYDGQPITAHATTHFGTTAVPILTANTEKGLECGTSYLLWWKAYIMAKNLGMHYYDLGGIDQNKNPKGYLFKKYIGGEEFFNIGIFEACANLSTLKVVHVAENCYRLLKR